MSNGMIFLAGFITGGFTVTVVLGMVMRERYHELMAQIKHERSRRIEAEDNPTHGQPIKREDWGPPLDVAGDGSIVMPAPKATIVDLTDIGDVPDE